MGPMQSHEVRVPISLSSNSSSSSPRVQLFSSFLRFWLQFRFSDPFFWSCNYHQLVPLKLEPASNRPPLELQLSPVFQFSRWNQTVPNTLPRINQYVRFSGSIGLSKPYILSVPLFSVTPSSLSSTRWIPPKSRIITVKNYSCERI